MKKFIFSLILSLLISFSAFAKTIEQKKDELQKIYEAGGISKIEHEKAVEFLEKSSDQKKLKKKKKKFKLKKKSKKKDKDKKNKKDKDKDKDKEEVTLEKIEELGEVVKFDESYYPESMLKEFTGHINSFKGTGQKAGSYMWNNFGKSSSWGQKYPGKMIKSMAMFEIFYASRLYQARKSIERFKENKYKNNFFSKKKKKEDEDKIRSLFGMNNGRENMRKALGMNMDTPAKEAIQKFWLLGEFLELGAPKDNNINVDKDIKERQDKLDVYKATISTLKKKLEERAEQKKSTKDKS